MFTFHFINFIGNLEIHAPEYEGIPLDDPVIIYYTENAKLTKHEIFRRFYRILQDHEITYLKPIKNITGEWEFNLKEFRHSFKCLRNVEYLQGSITIEPEYIDRKDQEKDGNIENSTCETSIKISVYQEEIELVKSNRPTISKELFIYLDKFKRDYSESDKCGFLMMKFEDSKIQKEIIQVLKTHLLTKKIFLLRADDKWYSDDLFENIKTYMHGCSFGIALFDRINTNEFNPNVSLEIGYMMALNKPVLLLKDKTLTSLQTDLVGKLYHQFDFQNPENTIPQVLDKWISDKGIE